MTANSPAEKILALENIKILTQRCDQVKLSSYMPETQKAESEVTQL